METRLAASTGSVNLSDDIIDYTATNAISSLIQTRRLSLAETVCLVRGETPSDPRPSKALDPTRLTLLLEGYEHEELLVRCATTGFCAAWGPPDRRLQRRPSNHKSASEYTSALLRSIRKGQDAGEYSVVALEVFDGWDIVPSPFDAVPKAGVDRSFEIRLIHDLSFPRGTSVNEATVQGSLPQIQYEHVSRIASRIEAEYNRLRLTSHAHCRILVLKGDVKSAFRHLRHNARDVRWMRASFPELGIGAIDMAAPFGWTGSPAFYGAFGRAISFIVGNKSPTSMCPKGNDAEPFFADEWVDDHIMVEVDYGNRCAMAADVL